MIYIMLITAAKNVSDDVQLVVSRLLSRKALKHNFDHVY